MRLLTLRSRLVLISLFFAGLACQTAERVMQPGARLSETAEPPTPTTSPSLPPSTTPSPVPSHTITPHPPTDTPTPRPTPNSSHLQVFEELWTIVSEEYLYPDFNGLDWEAVGEEYRQRVELGLNDESFYNVMDEMLARLEDDHTVFLSPAQALQEDAEYAGEYDYVGIGALISAQHDRERAVVLVTFPGSPAELAGLSSRDSLLAVDGEPILDEHGNLRRLLRGTENSQVLITVQSPGEPPRDVALRRQLIAGPIPVPYTILHTPEGRRIGHVFIVTFTDSSVDDQVAAAIRDMSADGPLDGLIVDNRHNEGGADVVMRGVLTLFADGLLGHFVNRTERRALLVAGVDLEGSQELPLVVLVGSNTVSFGEIFAGVLQDVGRAYLIGEPTRGNVETLWGYDLSDGSRAWIAHDSFYPRNHPDKNWESEGVIPDLTIQAVWEAYRLEDDPVVLAALAYLDERPDG